MKGKEAKTERDEEGSEEEIIAKVGEEEDEKGANKRRIQRNKENTKNMRKRMVRKRRREME